MSSFCPELGGMHGGVVSELSFFTPGPSQDRVKPLPQTPDPFYPRGPAMEEPTLHPAAPAARLAELFPQLCFLSCSQYTQPQICLLSFFRASWLVVQALPPSSLVLAWEGGLDDSVPACECVACLCGLFVTLGLLWVRMCGGLEVRAALSLPWVRT